MPRGREELRQYLKGCLERVERVPDDEPWSQIRFPRQQAKQRIINKEKKTRIVFEATPEQYAAFHMQLKRYRDVIENVTLATDIMIGYLAHPSDEELLAVRDEQEGQKETLGNA